MLFALVLAATVLGQEFKFPYEHQCGSPLVQSQTSFSVPALLKSVESSGRLRVRLDSGRELLVRIAGVEIQDRGSFQKLLQKQIGERITLRVRQSQPGKKTDAKVLLGMQDLGSLLLEKRIAKFVNRPGYQLTSYEACVYRHLAIVQ